MSSDPVVIALTILGAAAVIACAVALVRLSRRRHDEIFLDVTPGQFPAPGQRSRRGPVKGREYSDAIAVAFAPPPGLTPGLVGTVVDGKADLRDVTATLIDLAVRGHLKIVALPKASEKAKQDWELRLLGESTKVRASAHRPPDELSPFEARLLGHLFNGRTTVLMSQLTGQFGQAMREARVELYRAVVDRGWYRGHPLDRRIRLGWLAGALILVGLGIFLAYGFSHAGAHVAVVPAALFVLAGALLLPVGRTQNHRTAEGTAVRIQALGFKEYLATAEAGQIRFEEAATIFNRYLPYAIVFGVAEHWAKVFGEVAKRAADTGYGGLGFDLFWFDALDGALDAIWLADLLTDATFDVDFAGIADAVGNGLGGLGEAAGHFVDAAGGIDLPGDGCDVGGCDGCDVGGCDF